MKSLIACSALALLIGSAEGTIVRWQSNTGERIPAVNTLLPDPSHPEQPIQGGTWVHQAVRQGILPLLFLEDQMSRTNNTILTNQRGVEGPNLPLTLNDPNLITIVMEDTLRTWANIPDESGSTPVHLATSGKRHFILSQLLQYGGNVNLQDNNRQTPLHIAALFPAVTFIGETPDGRITVNNLLEKDPDLTIKDRNGDTALHLAMKGNNQVVVDKILEKNPDVTIQDANGNTPLHLAVGAKNINWVSTMLRLNPDLTIKNRRGNTPIHVAAGTGNTQILRSLLESVSDPEQKKDLLEIKNDDGQTPLHLVATFVPQSMLGGTSSNREALSFLADSMKSLRLSLNPKDNQGRTPFYFAIEKNNFPSAKVLLNFGADPNILDANGYNPFHLEIRNSINALASLQMDPMSKNITKNKEVKRIFSKAQWLLDNNADINFPNKDGNTALHIAVYHVSEANNSNGNILAIRWLTEKENRIPQSSENSDSSINSSSEISQNSSSNTSSNELNHMIVQRVNIDAQNNDGNTPLLLSLMAHRLEIASYLLDQGASPDLMNSGHYTPLLFAARFNDIDLFDKIMANSKDLVRLIYTISSDHSSPIFFIATNNNVSFAKKIIAACSNNVPGLVNLWDNNKGWTSLHYAADTNSVEMAKWLVEHVAVADTKDYEGHSPIDLARAGNNFAMLRVLGQNIDSHSNINNNNSDQAVGRRTNGITALMQKLVEIPSEQNFKDIEKMLLTGSDPNTTDNNGNTSLHYALTKIQSQQDPKFVLEVIKLLLRHGANPLSQYGELETPLALARQILASNNAPEVNEIVELLAGEAICQRINEDLSAQENQEQRNQLIMQAISTNCQDLINSLGLEGKSPLYVAIEKGNNSLAKQLYNAGASVKTPIWVKGKQTTVFKTLTSEQKDNLEPSFTGLNAFKKMSASYYH
ncbi:MAG: ankyrin repeat domain-containing protein [Alphaproteobacteria bacterium]|nr:ankyrin repeat domain-containing protein [Alphaproteobacteria bacterium]